MYQPGDHVLLKQGGIWQITALNADSTYSLKAYSDGRSLEGLTAESGEIIRPVCSKETLEEALSRLPYLQAIRVANDKVRKEFYDNAMAQYDELEWITVIKTIYLRQEEKRLLPYEAPLLTTAKSYFHEEVSLLMEVPLAEVEDYIANGIAQDIW